MRRVRIVPLLDPEPRSGWAIRQLEQEGGRREVEEYLESLSPADMAAADGKFRALLTAPPFQQLNTFKALRNVQNVWEVVVGRHRFLGFRFEMVLVLTNGFPKKSNQTPRHEIEHCTALRQEWEASRGGSRK